MLNKSYINKITSGRALPSMHAFLQICDYFDIAPKDFFDEGLELPNELTTLVKIAASLKPENIELLISLAEKIAQ